MGNTNINFFMWLGMNPIADIILALVIGFSVIAFLHWRLKRKVRAEMEKEGKERFIQ